MFKENIMRHSSFAYYIFLLLPSGRYNVQMLWGIQNVHFKLFINVKMCDDDYIFKSSSFSGTGTTFEANNK